MSERPDFVKAHKEVEEALNWVVQILPVIYAQKVGSRHAWTNLLFNRLFNIAHSMLTLSNDDISLKKSMSSKFCFVDHCSIAALSRTLLDTWLMFAYVSEIDLLEEEWLRRRAALELHHVTARYRMLKSIGDEKTEEAKEYKSKMPALRQVLTSDPIFQSLDIKIREDVIAGRSPYTIGRNEIVRRAGWDVDHFTGMFACLSSQTHSAPAGFYRSAINPDEPENRAVPDFQYLVAGLALDLAVKPLHFACERMFHLYPEVFLKGETKH